MQHVAIRSHVMNSMLVSHDVNINTPENMSEQGARKTKNKILSITVNNDNNYIIYVVIIIISFLYLCILIWTSHSLHY